MLMASISCRSWSISLPCNVRCPYYIPGVQSMNQSVIAVGDEHGTGTNLSSRHIRTFHFDLAIFTKKNVCFSFHLSVFYNRVCLNENLNKYLSRFVLDQQQQQQKRLISPGLSSCFSYLSETQVSEPMKSLLGGSHWSQWVGWFWVHHRPPKAFTKSFPLNVWTAVFF